jgi:hypothetical protein
LCNRCVSIHTAVSVPVSAGPCSPPTRILKPSASHDC